MKTVPAKGFYGLACLCFLLLLLSACNKNEELGTSVNPPEDLLNVGFNAVIPITAHTVRDDSIRTDETVLNLLGSNFDPVFGKTTASVYTQFRLTDNDVSFGTNPVCDSIVLSLAYGTYFGDTNTLLTLDVYEVAESFYPDSAYYSYSSLGRYRNNLGNVSFKPRPNDSVQIGLVKYPPHLRVKLKKTLGQKFIDASGTYHLANNTNFLEYFKGLYITTRPVSTGGIIMYMNLLSSVSRLTLYYHNNADTSAYTFVLNENCARFNVFNHYQFAAASQSLRSQLAGDTSGGDNVLFLQPMGGTRVHLKFPEALSLNNLGTLAINKAELVINVDQTEIDKYGPPDKLTLILINTDGTLSYLPDYAYGELYFGGSYNSTTWQYRFNISTYIQNALINKEFYDRGLYMTVSGASVNARRAVIFGPKVSEKNLRLEVIYTKIN